MLIHVVQAGESLWLISNRHGVGVNRIIEVNGLENPNQLVIGQALIIPTPDMVHVVRAGDTLWTIARLYGTTVNAFIQENQISNPNLINVGQVLRIPKPSAEVNGYLTQTGAGGENITRQTAPFLTYLSMFSYAATSNGNIVPLNDASVLSLAKSARTSPLLSVTNTSRSGFDSQLAHTILASFDLQGKLIFNILTVMKQKGYTGLNLDFEYVFPADRKLYNQFLALVVSRLHEQRFTVSTALAPKITADQKGLLYEAHDYPVHGQLADFVVLMTYEWGWVGGPPMAVAPLNEVKRVLDYAVKEIPSSKILMGVPLYGYDWKLPYVQGTSLAETISQQEALSRAIRYVVSILYDPIAQSPYFNYTDSQGSAHVVWFEDARSYQAKYDTVKAYGLRGVSYWSLNVQTPQNWPLLNNTFNIRKLL